MTRLRGTSTGNSKMKIDYNQKPLGLGKSLKKKVGETANPVSIGAA